MVKLKPSKKGLKVHNPATKLFLKEDGEHVSNSTYWRRRLKCGDVVEVREEKKPIIKKTVKKSNKKMEVES